MVAGQIVNSKSAELDGFKPMRRRSLKRPVVDRMGFVVGGGRMESDISFQHIPILIDPNAASLANGQIF